MTVRTRFAPSPTGFLHVGGARTALFCWLEARHRAGEFVLRIEDTDRERSSEAAVNAIIEGMAWLGLKADEGPIFQTHRFDRYRQVAEQLLEAGKAYRCYMSKEELDALRQSQEAQGLKPRYNGYWRDRKDPPPAGIKPVIRFKNPREGAVRFVDRIHGETVVENSELDDLVLWRSDESPTYNFGVVVDDADMRITDVIRGDDHLNNTPRQINIYEALGLKAPSFAHLPMILGSDGTKLSKRHGAVSVLVWRDDGYLPQALLNYLVRLGWSHGDQEVFSLDEMIQLFDVGDCNKSASRFDTEKLKWLNAHYLKTLDAAEVAAHLRWHLEQRPIDLKAGPKLEDVVLALRERATTLVEMADKAEVYFGPLQHYDEAAVSKQLVAAAREPLQRCHAAIAAVLDWSPSNIHAAIEQVARDLGVGLGKVGPALRVAMVGGSNSPSIDHTVFLVGREQALRRIDAALSKIPA
jgi:glutamyl-tRNA synthetase